MSPDASGLRRPANRSGRWMAAVVALVVFGVDQATKRWALDRLTTSCGGSDAQCIELPGVTLRLVFNTGAAFATGTGLGPLLGILVIAVCAVVVMMIVKSEGILQPVLLGGVLGGALGNLTDRIARAEDGPLSGAVVDFIDLGWWPVFNIADAAIVGSVIGLIGVAFFSDEETEVETETTVEAADEVNDQRDAPGDDVVVDSVSADGHPSSGND